MTTPRIYIACLASYNAGRLHGRWIDVSDVDTMKAEIAAMLRASPFPNVEVECPECDGGGWRPALDGDPLGAVRTCPDCKGRGTVPSAEEWAAHDYDGVPASFGEYPALDYLVAYVDAFEEHGDAFAAYWEHSDHADPEDAADDFLDKYQGEYDTERAWAEQFLADTGVLADVPESLQHFIDFDAYARDSRIGGDVNFIRHGGSLYVFWS